MICISIVEKDLEVALTALKKAQGVADWVEIRLDALEKPCIKPFIEHSALPLLFTFRDRTEGGLKETDLSERLLFLEEALEKGAQMVDIELRAGKKAFLRLKRKCTSGQRVLVSYHDFQATPPLSELRSVFEEMLELGAPMGKIVTTAHKREDNFIPLFLLYEAQKKGFSLISFAMGPIGKVSRALAPLLGAPFTYASLTGYAKAAPGQISAFELRKIWASLQA